MERYVLITTNNLCAWSTGAPKDKAQAVAEYAPIVDAILAGERVSKGHPLIDQMLLDLDIEHMPIHRNLDIRVTKTTVPYRIDGTGYGDEVVALPTDTEWWV